jgi:hypothetical protein
MIDAPVHNIAIHAEAVARSVHIHGASNIDITMTPAAAFDTAHRIGEAAIDALMHTSPTAAYIGN